ncbi:MAG: Fur family transcriptional regulator [Chloroflexota bacterium]
MVSRTDRTKLSRIASAVTRLEAQGHRVTAPRRKVVASVLSWPGQFSAEDLAEGMPDVGRATVFRTLKLLVELGVVCRVMLEGGRFRYRLSYPDHHHHMVCLSCERVEDLVDGSLEATMRRVAQKSRFAAEGHWLEIYGRCSVCQAAAGAPRGGKRPERTIDATQYETMSRVASPPPSGRAARAPTGGR